MIHTRPRKRSLGREEVALPRIDVADAQLALSDLAAAA